MKADYVFSSKKKHQSCKTQYSPLKAHSSKKPPHQKDEAAIRIPVNAN